MKPDGNIIYEEDIAKSFEDFFTEYKRRIALSRLFLTLSFLLFSLAVVFCFIYITVGVFFFILGFYSKLISKRHLFIATIAERFIMSAF